MALDQQQEYQTTIINHQPFQPTTTTTGHKNSLAVAFVEGNAVVGEDAISPSNSTVNSSDILFQQSGHQKPSYPANHQTTINKGGSVHPTFATRDANRIYNSHDDRHHPWSEERRNISADDFASDLSSTSSNEEAGTGELLHLSGREKNGAQQPLVLLNRSAKLDESIPGTHRSPRGGGGGGRTNGGQVTNKEDRDVDNSGLRGDVNNLLDEGEENEGTDDDTVWFVRSNFNDRIVNNDEDEEAIEDVIDGDEADVESEEGNRDEIELNKDGSKTSSAVNGMPGDDENQRLEGEEELLGEEGKIGGDGHNHFDVGEEMGSGPVALPWTNTEDWTRMKNGWKSCEGTTAASRLGHLPRFKARGSVNLPPLKLPKSGYKKIFTK